MRRAPPSRIRSDLVARWLIVRSRTTVAEIMSRMIAIEGDEVQYTIRGDAPGPVFDVTLQSDGIATLVSASRRIDPGMEIHATQVDADGRLSRPHLRLRADIPETTRLAAVGRPLRTLVDCADLGTLADAHIASVRTDEDDGTLEIMLEPDWVVHQV